MKTKILLLVMAALFATGGTWLGWAAWRAHRQLVTLDMRERPLAEVLRQIEWQTWQKIRAEKSLADVRVSLHVTDKPLPDVLNRLAAQVGAHWSRLFAVYHSSGALKGLDAALRGDGHFEPAGWKKIAPEPSDAKADDQNLPGPPLGHGQFMLFRRANDGETTIVQDGNGHTEIWSAEELVMESALTGRIGDEHRTDATAGAAAGIARKIGGRWTTYFAFAKSSVGIGFGGIQSPRLGLTQMEPGTNGPKDRLVKFPPGPNLAAPPPFNPNDRFANLTPQGRVQFARERQPAGGEFKRQGGGQNVPPPSFQSQP